MKKFIIAAAVAGTAMAAQAQAKPWKIIDSSIDRSELSLAGMDEGDEAGFLYKADSFQDSLAFAASDLNITVEGDSYTLHGGSISLLGETSIVALDAEVFLSFDAQGNAQANGIILNQGAILISAETMGPDPVPLPVDEDPIDMTSDGVLNGVQYTGIPLSDGVINPDGTITITFAGIPESALDDDGLAMASAGATLLGMPAAIFLEGSITLQEVPLPGAAWLFGSALVGLGAARRKARAAA